MPALLQQGTVSSSTSPELTIWIMIAGVLADPFSISFVIFDISDGAKISAWSKAFPDDPLDAQEVDLVADRVSLGHYAAAYEVAADEPPGRHRIRWRVTLVEGGPTRVVEEDFDVIAGAVIVAGQALYCSISDMRDEGVTLAKYPIATDARLQTIIAFASQRIEAITGRPAFYPHAGTVTIDGVRSRALRFGEPVITISLLERLAGDDNEPLEIEANTYTVFNRHITQNLRAPDDRMDPRIVYKQDAAIAFVESYERRVTALRRSRSFFEGAQRYRVTGVFGYTDYDGRSFVGVTPPRIREACKLMVLRTFQQLAKSGNVSAAGGMQSITQEQTREQSVSYGSSFQDKTGSVGIGDMTGDAIVDQMLSFFAAPPSIGLV